MQFTTADARVKLKRLYRVIEPVKPAVAQHSNRTGPLPRSIRHDPCTLIQHAPTVFG
jgi:hypothetical protein